MAEQRHETDNKNQFREFYPKKPLHLNTIDKVDSHTHTHTPHCCIDLTLNPMFSMLTL